MRDRGVQQTRTVKNQDRIGPDREPASGNNVDRELDQKSRVCSRFDLRLSVSSPVQNQINHPC